MTIPSLDQRSGISRWGYLIFLVFVFVGPVFSGPDDAWRWIMEASVVVSVAAIYIWSGHRGPSSSIPAAIAVMAIGVAVTPLASSALAVVPVYAAAMVSTTGSRRQVIRRLAVIAGISVLALAFLSPVPWPYRAFLGVSLIMVWFVGVSVQEDISLAREADALRAENARIQHLATVTERERIARDLHDVVGQTLTAAILRAQLVQRLAHDDPDRAAAEATGIEESARGLLTDVRSTVSGWQQASMADEVAKAAEALAVVDVEFSVTGVEDADGLAPSVETVLALALREGVTNVVRHARATSCTAKLSHRANEVVLEIADDGIGHDGTLGTGLRGMAHRVTAAGGRLSVDGEHGTRLEVAIPVGGPA